MTHGGRLRTLVTGPDPALHVVLCPFAGGSGAAFRSWHGIDAGALQVSLAIYPGRDHRLHEACSTDIGTLAADLVAALVEAQIAPQRAVLAGHSMGAQVAFEACALLERQGNRRPAWRCPVATRPTYAGDGCSAHWTTAPS
ncbi:thioesterase domain-containing protein [Xanthomonas hortorum pv. pelargonii]|nr:thioesterase domain-containing protein [Xanthomonas hortorum]UUF02345.1 thioesterase domain-containing protein [Xanthomonas hortorum pv. pelargonii]UXM98646.1 thioesterase domain-containing protein [Xanthomonas hortorum pv. pelargonii]